MRRPGRAGSCGAAASSRASAAGAATVPIGGAIPDLIRTAKERGGRVVVNHYVDDGGEPRPFTPAQLADFGVDGAEIANGWEDLAAFGTTAEMRGFCLSRKLACTSGSDEHQNRELSVFMRVGRSFAGAGAAEVLDELARNRHQVVQIEAPGPFKVPYAWRIVDDPARVVNHLLTMDRGASAAWLGWTAALLAGAWLRARRRSGKPQRVY